MATSFNSNSSSSFRVGRKVKKIVSQIQSLIEKHSNHSWYDGKWWCGGAAVTTETEALSIRYANDGIHFWYADFYGDPHFKVIPYDAKLLSRLRNLQEKIWVGMHHVVSRKQNIKNTIPAWALKRGCYPHI